MQEQIEKIKSTVFSYYKEVNCNVKKVTENSLGIYELEGFRTGFAITDADIELFLEIREKVNIKNIYIIGNAFGYSTFVLSNIFPKAKIDVIDAECEGNDNRLGSEITRKIIENNKLDINLFIGFSPEDVERSMRTNKYELIFIDGLHTKEQIRKDLDAVKNYCADNFFIVCHDVELASLQESIDRFLNENQNFKYEKYEGKININSVGTGFLTKKEENE